MAPRDILTVLLTTFASMALLYAPQPLFPVLAERFAVSQTEVASLISWSLLPMAVAPLLVGLLMQVVAPRRVLAGSALLLGATEIAFAGVGMFWGAVVLRFMQGALVSMLLAATMTYVSLQAQRVSRIMGFYVAASVLGGLLGRLFAGYGAAWIGVPVVFLALGALALGGGGLAWGLTPEPKTPQRSIEFSRLTDVLRIPSLALLYGVVFSAFFVFTALLNFVPFRVGELGLEGTGATGLVYIGFLSGIGASLLAEQISDSVGGSLRAAAGGSVILIGSLGLAWMGSFLALTGALVGASAGFFLLHAVLSGYVNRHAGDEASTVNGLYVAIYYAGGAAGSYFPGLVYEAAGWTSFLGALGAIGLLGMLFLWLGAQVGPLSLSRLAEPGVSRSSVSRAAAGSGPRS